jgi:hypothetical protein
VPCQSFSYIDLDGPAVNEKPLSTSKWQELLYSCNDRKLALQGIGKISVVNSDLGPDGCREALTYQPTAGPIMVSSPLALCESTDLGRVAFLKISSVSSQGVLTVIATAWENS